MNTFIKEFLEAHGYDTNTPQVQLTAKFMEAYSSVQNADLLAENKRLSNDLLDALDLKEGKGPTALSMVTAENKELKEALSTLHSMTLYKLSPEDDRDTHLPSELFDKIEFLLKK